MNRRTITAAAVLALVAVVAVALYARAAGRTDPTAAEAPAAMSTAAATADRSGLRQVHTVKVVRDDMHLRPGTCRMRYLDKAKGLVLPDPACTPGAVDPAVTQDNLGATICSTGYTRTVRPAASVTNRFKTASMLAYGLPASDRNTIEYDHLVSLQLGGASSTSNLFAQPNKAGAKGTTNPKDAVEDRLNDAVCHRTFVGGKPVYGLVTPKGRVTLAAAQAAIAADWTTAEQVLGLK